MLSENTIIFNIEYYQGELNELYSLLLVLENDKFLNKCNVENKDLSDIKNNIKFLSFFISSFLDILTSLKVLYDTKISWERKFHIKNAFVAIYETIKTFNVHQKDIRNLILNRYNEIENEYNSVNKKVKEFKKKHKYDTNIADFRNKAGAHYSKDFIEYIENLNKIDNPNSFIGIVEFSYILNDILNLWEKIIEKQREELITKTTPNNDK